MKTKENFYNIIKMDNDEEYKEFIETYKDFLNTMTEENISLKTEEEYHKQAIRELGVKIDILRLIPFLIVSVLFAFFYYYMARLMLNTNKLMDEQSIYEMVLPLSILSIALGVTLVIVGILIKWRKNLIELKIDNLKKEDIKKKSFKDKDSSKEKDNAFDVLSSINIDHLNKYYTQTYNQCDKSFHIANIANNASYIILAAGIVFFFVSIIFLKEEKSRLIMFGITTSSGVIIKVISSLYFYIYNQNVTKLNSYHDKLYNIQNILISLELSNQIEDPVKKDDIKSEMIKRLIDSNFNNRKKE